MAALGTTNISVDLVNTTIGEGSNDLRALCVSNRINKWSKYKPVVFAGDTDLLANFNWWKTLDNFCGLSIEKHATIESLISAVENGTVWTYNHPTGGAISPYRLGDFRKYLHAATAPVEEFYTPGISYNNLSTSKVAGSISFIMGAENSSQLGLDDIEDFANYYFGIAIKRKVGPSDYLRWCTEPNKISGTDAAIEIAINTLPVGTYVMYPFLSSVKKTDPTAVASSTFIAFDGIVKAEFEIKNNPFTISIFGNWKDDDMNSGVIEYVLTAENEYNSQLTLSGCSVACRFAQKAFDDSLVSGETLNSISNISVAANGSTTVTGSFNASKTDSLNWKLWFKSTAPYNLLINNDIENPVI